MHYRIALPENPFARQLLTGTLEWLAAGKKMQPDRSRLKRACCAPPKFVTLQGAPRPRPCRIGR